MSKMPLPSVFNERPTRVSIRKIPGIERSGIATKVARNIYVRCRLAEAQNWRCCWCGMDCRPESNYANSATIEHVQPRSQGGSDDWDNLAMACASCNHRRGVISVEDMLAGRFPKPKPANIKSRKKAKSIEKYIKKAIRMHEKGWVKADGSPLCKHEWFATLHIYHDSHRERLKAVVFDHD